MIEEDHVMLRRLAVATLAGTALLAALPRGSALQAQQVGVLHIKIVVLDADRKPIPVPRHALLISDNPATSTPRRVVTTLEGTADVRLRPGNYTIESDVPFAFQGKAYEWRRVIDVVAGRDATLELSTANAEISAAATAPAADAPVETSLSSLLIQWQDSVVALWTPTTHASGFLIDASGLVATSQRLIGAATSVEVQLAPDVKVAGNVLESNADRDVAVLWIDPAVAASIRPVPLGCADAAKPAVAAGQEIFTIGAPMRQQKGPSFGGVSRVETHEIESDLVLPSGSAGGPVFTSAGRVVGVTSVADEKDDRRRGSARIIRLDDLCEVVASAGNKMKTAARPDAKRLPVEPAKPFPEDALTEAAKRRVGSLNPYQLSTVDFDVAFITPVMTYGAEYLAQQMSARGGGRGGRGVDSGAPVTRPLLEFANWSDYTADFPPVLLVRVTPKLVEGFWTKVARGAASTQGVALPAFKRARSGFARLRAFCGDAEIVPIHPFKIEQRVTETEAIYEGLYVFDPGAFDPSCGSVKIVVYSEKEPDKADSRVVDAKVIQQIWQDFAPLRGGQ